MAYPYPQPQQPQEQAHHAPSQNHRATSPSSFPPTPSGTTEAAPPLSITKSFRPYYSPAELVQLVRLQAATRGEGQRKELSDARIEGWRQLASGFIERVGGRLGFPRRTVATAQTLYHRFHLHFPLLDFAYHDVSVAALLVSSKLEDTLKKLREIQIAGWQISSLLEGGPGTGEGDVAALDAHRPQLIAVERLILQSVCFNFNLHRSPFVVTSSLDSPLEVGISGRDVFGWVFRLSRALGASKSYTFLSHLLAIDVHRTLAPLSYPPHTVALACLYLTSFLTLTHPNSLAWRSEEPSPTAEPEGPTFAPGWTLQYESTEADVQEIAHSLLNLFIQLCPSPSPTKPSPTYSPSSAPTPPSNPSALASGVPHALSGQVQVSARTEDEFTRVKIWLRRIGEREEGVERGRKRGWKGEGEGEGGRKAVSVRYRF